MKKFSILAFATLLSLAAFSTACSHMQSNTEPQITNTAETTPTAKCACGKTRCTKCAAKHNKNATPQVINTDTENQPAKCACGKTKCTKCANKNSDNG